MVSILHRFRTHQADEHQVCSRSEYGDVRLLSFLSDVSLMVYSQRTEHHLDVRCCESSLTSVGFVNVIVF